MIRIDPLTGAQQVVSSGGVFQTPVDIAATDKEIFVADANFGMEGAVIRVDPATGAQTVLSAGGNFRQPQGIAIDAHGDLVVADLDSIGGNGAAIKVSAATGAQTVISADRVFAGPRAVTVAENGDILITEDVAFGGKGVIRLDPATGAQTVVATGGDFSTGTGIATESSGAILVSDASAFDGNGGVIRIDPQSGVQSTVLSASKFGRPQAVTVGPDGDILVASSGTWGAPGAVVDVNPRTGEESKVSYGQNLDIPSGIAYLDTTAPTIERLSVKPRKIAQTRGSTVARKARRRATARYVLSENAVVAFTVERLSKGRKVGSKCVRRAPGSSRGRRCIRVRRLARFSQSGATGKNSVSLKAILGKRRMRGGKYRVTAQATDTAGHVSKRKTASLKVVRR